MAPTLPPYAPRRACTLTRALAAGVLTVLVLFVALALHAQCAQAGQLLQTDQQIDTIRSNVRLGKQPWASSWTWFKGGHVKTAMADTPKPYVGPIRTGGVGSTLEKALDRDGYRARNVAIAFAVTGDKAYASKARSYILAWAKVNVPTKYSDCGDKYMGTYQSHGAFCFAYAYDLTVKSGVYTTADHDLVKGYFRRFAAAMKTYMDVLRADPVLRQTTLTKYYGWIPNGGRKYNVYDYYLGGDLPALTTVARFALARMGGATTDVSAMLKATDILSVQSIVMKASAPRNSGDGKVGHPNPVPQVQIFKPGYYDNSSRGGCVDYMTYNQRAATILLIMAQRAGADMTTPRAKALLSWRYLARFFGPNAERSPAPNDYINMSVNLPRMVLPLYLYGTEFLADAQAGDERTYYESQFLGPTTLTFWR
jgi:hypothetical protein